MFNAKIFNARIRRRIGQEVLFNKKHRSVRELVEKKGVKTGIFENITKTAGGFLYTISFGPNGNKCLIDIERRAFRWKEKPTSPPPRPEIYDRNRWR